MQDVAQQRVSLERFFGCQRYKDLAVVIPQEASLSTLAVRPFKHLAFHGTGNGEGKMRLPRSKFVGAQKMQQNTERLLRDVFMRDPRLLFADATDRGMQHWQENKNQKTIHKRGIDFAARDELAEQLIGSRVRRGRSQMQEQNRNR